MLGYLIVGLIGLGIGLPGGAVLWRLLTKGTDIKRMKEELQLALKNKVGEGKEELEKLIDEL